MNIKNCIKCSKDHTNSGNFCSRSCANSRIHTTESKLKIKNALTGRKCPSKIKGTTRAARYESFCQECGLLLIDTYVRKYCAGICTRKNSGGYRANSGYSKSGYYKGIYCGSTYELVWAIYHLDHNIQFKRFESKLQLNDLIYYPDFIIDNTIYEMKGYEYEKSVNNKSDLARSLGYDIVVLFKKDLKFCFDWVKNNYEYKALQELYDNHKPKYSFNCDFCKIDFTTENNRKAKNKFCSQTCSGKFRTYVNHKL